MKTGTPLIKYAVNFLCLPLKKNNELRKYVYKVALKHETENYCENEFFKGYYHIEKAIRIIKKNNIDEHIIVDVGGATGVTAKIFSQHFQKTKIWVFEPLEENYKVLQSLSSENNNLVIIPKAAGNKKGKTGLNIAKRITSSSLFKLNPDKNSNFFSEILETKDTKEIEITTLDDTLPDNKIISILKLDVQGYELEVLKGAGKTLTKTFLIILEMNNHDGYMGAPKYYEVDKYLRENNFILFDIFPSVKDDDQLKEWDCIYVNKSSLK